MMDYRTGCPEPPVEPPERADQEEINRYFYKHSGMAFLDWMEDDDG